MCECVCVCVCVLICMRKRRRKREKESRFNCIDLSLDKLNVEPCHMVDSKSLLSLTISFIYNYLCLYIYYTYMYVYYMWYISLNLNTTKTQCMLTTTRLPRRTTGFRFKIVKKRFEFNETRRSNIFYFFIISFFFCLNIIYHICVRFFHANQK